MEGNEQKTGQNVEGMDIIKQFMQIMEQQNRQEQSQDFMEMFRYMAGMQVQLGVMADELQNVRKQLSAMQNTNPKNRQLARKVSHLQVKISGLSKRISAVKKHLVDTIAKSVTAFREKGKQEMNKVLNRGISGVKTMLAGCREKMVDLLTDYEKTANQIDSIGDELKQIGNSFANVGRLVTGKGTKEVSEEKLGVGLTRVLNMPVKRNIAVLRNHIEKIDRAMNKLDTISAGLEPEKQKAERGEKPKEKTEKQSEKEEKSKEKTEKQPEKEEPSKEQEKQAGEEKPQKKTEKEQNPEKNPPKKDMEKGAEKKERVSAKEKLSEMKAKSEQQKKEPEAAKAKSKEECL